MQEAWNKFVDTSFERGAGALYRMTKVQGEWQPLVVPTQEGQKATEAANLEDETKVLHKHWKV